MNPNELVRPSRENSIRFPILAVLDQTGLPREINWSATRNGPHHHLHFTPLGMEELANFHTEAKGLQLCIGKYVVENPFSVSRFSIVISNENGTADMVPEKEISGFQPIRLSSSLEQLSSTLLHFHTLHEKLKVRGPKGIATTAWEQFSKELLDIDRAAHSDPFSFWGNMIHEQLESG